MKVYPENPADCFAFLLADYKEMETKLALAKEALEKMVKLYESEHDDESTARPVWLREALEKLGR